MQPQPFCTQHPSIQLLLCQLHCHGRPHPSSGISSGRGQWGSAQGPLRPRRWQVAVGWGSSGSSSLHTVHTQGLGLFVSVMLQRKNHGREGWWIVDCRATLRLQLQRTQFPLRRRRRFRRLSTTQRHWAQSHLWPHQMPLAWQAGWRSQGMQKTGVLILESFMEVKWRPIPLPIPWQVHALGLGTSRSWWRTLNSADPWDPTVQNKKPDIQADLWGVQVFKVFRSLIWLLLHLLSEP